MLLDVNTATGSCDCGCTFYSLVYCIFVYAQLGNFSRISHMTWRSLSRRSCWLDRMTAEIMRILFISVLHIFVCTVDQFQSNTSHYDDSEINCWLSPPSTGIHWHAVCRPKEHLITLSERTPGCFGWNSSPSQFCPPRSVNVHLISGIHTIHFLYQPRQAQASTYHSIFQ